MTIESTLSGPANAVIPEGGYAQSHTLDGVIPGEKRVKPAFPTE